MQRDAADARQGAPAAMFEKLLAVEIDRTHLIVVQVFLRGRPLGAGQDLEAQLKAHHRRGQLLQNTEIPLGLRVSIDSKSAK
jgi:hypothetical protein